MCVFSLRGRKVLPRSSGPKKMSAGRAFNADHQQNDAPCVRSDSEHFIFFYSALYAPLSYHEY
jgi:hypothetical protein